MKTYKQDWFVYNPMIDVKLEMGPSKTESEKTGGKTVITLHWVSWLFYILGWVLLIAYQAVDASKYTMPGLFYTAYAIEIIGFVVILAFDIWKVTKGS